MNRMVLRLEIWLQKRKKGKGGVITLFLNLISSLYGGLLFVRHWLYDKGIMASTKAPLIVVSVGNITAGGSGKTPFVAFLAALLEKEYKVAILSRGYRSQGERAKSSFCVNKEGQEVLSWEKCGDEPSWLAKFCEKAVVIVGKRRIESALLAHKYGCTLAILDDGMQHRRLKRDVEIVVVEGRDPFGGGYFLPQGRLRERPFRIKHADLVVINGGITLENKKKLRSLTAAPFLEGEMVLKEVSDREGRDIEIKGQKIALFCAIGSPDRFVDTVNAIGCKVVATAFLPDHRAFTEKQLLSLAEKATREGAYYLCCTEKDWIKLPLVADIAERVLVIKGEFVVVEDREEGLMDIFKRIKLLAEVEE